MIKKKHGKIIKTISMHFIIQGKFFTNKIQGFILEHKMTMAQKFLDDLRPLPTFEQRQAIIQGDAKFIGNTLCDNKKCNQCKSLRHLGDFRFVFKPDLVYKKRLLQHQEYLSKYCVVVDGDVAIGKKLVAELIIAKTILDETKKIRYKEGEYDRLESRELKKNYVEALDDWEVAQNSLYQQLQVQRNKDYPVGTREWKAKLEAESVLDIITSQAMYDPEIQELITDARNAGFTTAMATEKLFATVQRGMENHSVMEYLANKIERPKPKKVTKETVKVGKFNVPKNIMEDYKNAVAMASSSAMLFKARYGSLDPAVELKRFQGRVELHKKIFVALGLPYHQDIERKKKQTKREKDSLDLQDAISEYLEKN